MDKKNQRKQIWAYMLKYGSITKMEGYEKLKITKVDTRISEMLREGYKIDKVFEVKVHEDGSKVRYMRYFPKAV